MHALTALLSLCVLQIGTQYLSNPEGFVWLSQVSELYVCTLRPWWLARSDAGWLNTHIEKNIKKPVDEDAPPIPAQVFSEAELMATWPLLQQPPRVERQPPVLRTHFEVAPERGNDWVNHVRKKPMKAVSPNFWQKTRYVRRKGKQQVVLDPAPKNMKSIALNAHIRRMPFMSERFSLAMPGRFLQATKKDMSKPWEATARDPFSQLWTAPRHRQPRQGPDPYGAMKIHTNIHLCIRTHIPIYM